VDFRYRWTGRPEVAACKQVSVEPHHVVSGRKQNWRRNSADVPLMSSEEDPHTIPVLFRYNPAMSELENAVCKVTNSLLTGKDRVKVLEAGCGSSTHIKLNPEVYAVGIDISKEQLEKNIVVKEKILGDIQEYPLPLDEFDVVICWMVLEHLPNPQNAMMNMFRSVKPEGLVVLGFPNLLSIKGIVTKFTPFWFHELFYKVMKYKSQHFPTYLRKEIVPANVAKFAEENGFSVVLTKVVEGGVTKRVRNRFRAMDFAFIAVDRVTNVLSSGKLLSPLLDECAIVLQKRGVNS
jgi:SAM-dependent methyltransferase